MDKDEFLKVIADEFQWSSRDGGPDKSVLTQFNRILERGDGWAVFENVDLGHPDIGRKLFASFGSEQAQLETDEAPEWCPDGIFREITGGINYRYKLAGTYRGGAL